MGISSITTVAVARNMRTPTKSDAGEVTEDSVAAAQPPTLPDLLAKTVPVGLVTAYTAFTAIVTEVVAEPTPANPEPNQFLLLRWLALAALVVFAALLTYLSYRNKAEAGARFPTLEVAAVTVAAAAWGLAIPESPLLATVDQEGGLLLLALVGFIGVGINLVLSSMMRNPKAKQAVR